MLNQIKVLKELEQLPSLLYNNNREYEAICHIWHYLCANQAVQHAIKEVNSTHPIPTWQGSIDAFITVTSSCTPYTVIAVDGSQIYPDRHQGSMCSLINIGSVIFTYDIESSVIFDSVPTLLFDTFAQHEAEEMINCLRTEREMQLGVTLSHDLIAQQPILLLDGSLIFWHLENKDPGTYHRFLASYLTYLERLYEQQTLHAGYISLPKSKELINCVRRACLLPELVEVNEQYKDIACTHTVDSDLAQLFLKPFTRSTLFEHQSPSIENYPQHLKPYFFYLHNGQEIARVEIPVWIACQEALVEKLASIILDQCIKGNGYPICLAEAHEQAVIKSADRDIFYHLLENITRQTTGKYTRSIKSVKKHSVAI